MEYTKGEWEVKVKRQYLHEPEVSIPIWTPHGQMILEADGIPAKGEMYANALLCAAAPNMYEVLKEAQLQIEYLHEKFGETGSGNQVLSKIQSVIQKAEGK